MPDNTYYFGQHFKNEDPDDSIDTTNSQLVASSRGKVLVLSPWAEMSKEEALRHAAWLVVMADDCLAERFLDILRAVEAR